jgi:hypothetical protein
MNIHKWGGLSQVRSAQAMKMLYVSDYIYTVYMYIYIYIYIYIYSGLPTIEWYMYMYHKAHQAWASNIQITRLSGAL